jgi:hypothetical protein
MPMNRALYLADWDAIARRVKDDSDWRCDRCGQQCRRPGEKFDTHKRTLTVAHVDHNPSNCATGNLRALCSGCHLRYDAPEKARRRAAKKAACPTCASYRATLSWAEHKLRRLLDLSAALDKYDRATVRAVAESLSGRNPRIAALRPRTKRPDRA